MRISFKEPISPRYIHINPKTNRVHLLVPVVGGQDISTDNTCKANVTLKEFFESGALRSLTAYKNALEFDIALLNENNLEHESKEFRLAQIEVYIEAVSAMRYSYTDAIYAVMARPSNLYSIQLRPLILDHLSKVINPAFSINRGDNSIGIPLSPLYNVMQRIYPHITIPTQDPIARLTNAVLHTLPPYPSFEAIKHALEKQCKVLFDLSIDFTQCSDGTPATKEAIDTIMFFEDNATSKDYLDALLGACAPTIGESITTPFYSIPTAKPTYARTERLSIMTQFFLANLAVYCKAKNISKQNFGAIFDASPILSRELVMKVFTALSIGDDVERIVCTFFNEHADIFSLSRSLNSDDIAAIKQKFERIWRTITATEENPHMDDFLILDLDATGETAKFVTHQGSICINFAEIVDAVAASANRRYFERIRKDFAIHPVEISHKNESIADYVEIEPPVCMSAMSM
ncbi:MAG: hypothetical protein Q8M03_07955 [Legionella sp.]|nr:hypothetical protein [Legionella sp.]